MQLTLFEDLSRTYRPAAVDLRADEPPDNPWLAWALHLASTTAEARGFDPAVRRALHRNLVMLLATHAEGDRVRTSQFHHLIRSHGGALVHVVDVLNHMGVLLDDRPSVYETWLTDKLSTLTAPIADPVARWARLLRHGSARRRPRQTSTAMTYLNADLPALHTWSDADRDLREIRRDDITEFLEPLRGEPRRVALTGLRSLFRAICRSVSGGPTGMLA